MPMTEMIQNLVALSQLKNQREQMLLQQDQLAQAGNAQQFNQIDTITQRLGALPTGQREQLVASLRAAKVLPDAVLDQISSSLPTITGDPASEIARRAVNQGYANMTPSARNRASAEAANLAMTGQSRLETSKSGLLSTMLQNGSLDDLKQKFGAAVTDQWQKGLLEQLTTQQTPGQAAVDQQFAGNPALAATAAQVKAGAAPSASDKLSASVQMEGIRSSNMNNAGQLALGQADLAARMATARAKAGVTPQDQNDARERLVKIMGMLTQKGSSQNPASQQYLAMMMNQDLQMLGLPPIKPGDDIPAQVSGLSKLFGGIFGNTQSAAPMVQQHPQGMPGSIFGGQTP